jgi:hypothetical protein
MFNGLALIAAVSFAVWRQNKGPGRSDKTTLPTDDAAYGPDFDEPTRVATGSPTAPSPA